MNPWSIIASVAMLAGAGLLAWRHAADEPDGGPDDAPDDAPNGEPDEAVPPSSPAGRLAARVLQFFGIGGISLGLAGAVILGVAAVVCAALDIIAVLHFGRAYPSWFPANGLLVGLIVGLGCARVVAAPSRTS
jgi:hypothetical protein